MQTWPLMTIDEETSLVLPRAVLESYSEHGTSSSATPAAGNSFVAEIIASDDGAAFLSSGCFSGASFSGMPMVPASATPDAAARAEAPQGTQMLDEAGGVSKGNGAKRIRPKRPSRPSGVGCSDGTDEGSSSVAKKKTKRVRDRSSRTLCEFPGCKTGACSGSDNRMCKRHGGGHRCTIEGCDTSARGGTGLCIKHGGGKRCSKEGCIKAAQGQTDLCVAHGGGHRCQKPGCERGAISKYAFCFGHGGGRRCQEPGCNKGARGSTFRCIAHRHTSPAALHDVVAATGKDAADDTAGGTTMPTPTTTNKDV